jgi:hypothetical protein
LKPVATAWDREVEIQTGNIQPGQGPDFVGEVGPPDSSGIVDNTADVPRPQELALTISDAGWESSAEDYVINDDGPEGEVLVTVDEEGDDEHADSAEGRSSSGSIAEASVDDNAEPIETTKKMSI